MWNEFNLNHIVNESGEVTDVELQEKCFSEAEKALVKTLGCTIVYQGKKFVLSNLELYYGSAGDKAHDWWRTQYGQARGISKEHAAYQFLEGPRIYAKTKGQGNRNRMDLIIGPEGVAVSFLIRNLCDELGNPIIPEEHGGPGKLLNENVLNLQDSDIGEKIELLDTRDQYIKSEDQITRKKRYIGGRGYCGFQESFPERLWNFKFEK
ncbi:MAG: hypothetical protein NXH75_17010 [Halobacteriovoraceae bacterium]|nr:hypothetical protein [Halobacteriovoraceae bacterium]